MEIKDILSEFISIGAQIKYNLIKCEHQFEKKQLEILHDKMLFLGEDIPNIIFREKGYNFEGSISAKINYNLTNKQLCDRIFDFSLGIKSWAEENGLPEIMELANEMSELSNIVLLKITLEYLN